MKKTVLGLFAASMLVSSAAIAGGITGTISFSGEILGLGTDPQTGAEVNVDTANDNTTITFGTVLSLDGQRLGDFSELNGPIVGFFNDIVIVDGQVVTPINPLWTTTEAPGNGGSSASFSMSEASYQTVGDGNVPDPDFFVLAGTGVLSLTGFDDTEGEFRMTSEWPFLEFSSSNVAVAPVPAPGALGLMAMGLASLVAARRRGKMVDC